MGPGATRPMWTVMVLLMLLGLGVYLRLWSIDSDLSSEERELIRRQFDLANKEAMDESAEWRYKFDEEVERATKCVQELIQLKEALDKKVDESNSVNQRLAILQKENIGLLDRVESLTQELKTEKLKCNLR